MANFSVAHAVLTLGVTAGMATGCATTAGNPTAAESIATSSQTATPSSQTRSATTSSETSAPAPTGKPVGTATMQVSGGAGPVTIRYRINGEPERTETNVTLPWEKQYPVYDEVPSSVTADSGDAELICTITMDGNLVAFKTEPRPSCSFAYYG